MTPLFDAWLPSVSVEPTDTTILTWPHGLITNASTLQTSLNTLRRATAWIVVYTDSTTLQTILTNTSAPDRGQPETPTRPKPILPILQARFYKVWGYSANVQVWIQRPPHGLEPLYFNNETELGETFDEFLQIRMQQSYSSMGTGLFKPGTMDDDFSVNTISSAIMAAPTQQWGGKDPDMSLAQFREFPEEPTTARLPQHAQELTGCEALPLPVPQQEVDADMVLWKASGQTWLGAWSDKVRPQIEEFLKSTTASYSKAARKAYDRRDHTRRNCSDVTARYDRTPGFSVTQQDVRPAARGKLWCWENGKCCEMLHRTIRQQVGFSWRHVEEAARVVGFKDQRILQMMTSTGATHGTTNFPMTSHFYPNHQGSAKHFDLVTPMIIDKV